MSKEAPIHLSNLALADPKRRQADASRLQDFSMTAAKSAFAKRSGDLIDG